MGEGPDNTDRKIAKFKQELSRIKVHLRIPTYKIDLAYLREKLRDLREGRIPEEELYELIHDFGEAGFTEAEPEVAALREHGDPDFRYLAISVLTLHWDMPHHRDGIKRMLLQDSDDKVRAMAAGGLGHLARHSREPETAGLLVRKLRERNETGHVRESCYNALMYVWLDESAWRRRSNQQVKRDSELSSEHQERWERVYQEHETARLSGDAQRAEELTLELDRLNGEADRQWERTVDWEFVGWIEQEIQG